MELIGCGILLEEVHPWRWALRVHGLASLPVLPPSCVRGADVSPSFLLFPQCLLQAFKPSCRKGLSSLQKSSQNNAFISKLLFITALYNKNRKIIFYKIFYLIHTHFYHIYSPFLPFHSFSTLLTFPPKLMCYFSLIKF